MSWTVVLPMALPLLTTGQWLVVVVIPLVLVLGFMRAATDGRFRGTHRVRGADAVGAPEEASGVLAGTEYAEQLGAEATLLQFSSSLCAPCRTARIVLAEIADDRPGVTHLEIDAEHHLDLVRALGVSRTPTILVLDPAGHELARTSGVPSRDQVLAALASSGGS
ncbi:MAG: thioredoxin family protein [Nocardioides sp.]